MAEEDRPGRRMEVGDQEEGTRLVVAQGGYQGRGGCGYQLVTVVEVVTVAGWWRWRTMIVILKQLDCFQGDAGFVAGIRSEYRDNTILDCSDTDCGQCYTFAGLLMMLLLTAEMRSELEWCHS